MIAIAGIERDGIRKIEQVEALDNVLDNVCCGALLVFGCGYRGRALRIDVYEQPFAPCDVDVLCRAWRARAKGVQRDVNVPIKSHSLQP